MLRHSRHKGERAGKIEQKRESGWGCPARKACSVGLDRTSSLPLPCLAQIKIERARFPHVSALSTKATPSRLDYSRIVGLSGDELGSNHFPSLGCQRHKRGGGVLGGRRRGLKSLELGSPLRLVQLLLCAPFRRVEIWRNEGWDIRGCLSCKS